MSDVTYYLFAAASNTFPNFNTWSAARNDFAANNRMGGSGNGTIFGGVWYIKVRGSNTSAGNANMISAAGISAEAGGSFVIEADTNPWNASASNAMGYSTSFDGNAFGSGEGLVCDFGCPITMRNLLLDFQDGGVNFSQVSSGLAIAIQGCVLHRNVNTSGEVLSIQGSIALRNSAILNRSTSSGAAALSINLRHSASPTVEQCTLVCQSTATNGILDVGGTGATLQNFKNTYSGGATNPYGGITAGTGCTGNASSSTDQPGTSGISSLAVSTTQFQSVTGVGDWRAKSTSALATTGAARLASTTTDAYGQSRQTTTTIGAFEALTGGGGGSGVVRFNPPMKHGSMAGNFQG